MPLYFCPRWHIEHWPTISLKLSMVCGRENAFKFCCYSWCYWRGTGFLHYYYYYYFIGTGCLKHLKFWVAINASLSMSCSCCNCKVYWPKHEDINKILKVECTPLLGETKYPSIFVISSPVSPGILFPCFLWDWIVDFRCSFWKIQYWTWIFLMYVSWRVMWNL